MTAFWLATVSHIDAMLSVSAVVAAATAGLWIAARRLGLALISLFFLVAFAWRLASVFYIDLFGPLYSDQLARDIGPGISTLPIVISQGIVFLALLFSFRPKRVRELVVDELELASRLPPGRFSLSDLAFWLVAFFVAALYVELFVSGPIPLFVGIERFDYTRLYGGPLHTRLLEWGPMLAFQLGVFFAVPLLYDKSADRRFGVLFGSLILYLFLAAHRFSSFYAYTSFFIMPIGAILIAGEARSRTQMGMLSGKILRWLAVMGTLLSLLIAAAVLYSYVVVRAEGGELFAKLTQRILVQQGEMWWMTYERVFLQDDWSGGYAAYKLFVDPFVPTRNSTMQFLMELALPLQRAHYIIGQGSAYTGGWPEVFFELGGPIGGFVLVALSAIVFSEFMFLMTRCIVQGRFATCFFMTPILFALSIMIVSGMVNAFTQITFLVKVVAALIVYVTEDKWRSNVLFSRSSAGSMDGVFS